MPEILTTPAELKAFGKSARSRQSTKPHAIGFVPTMGALHEGHLSLARQALEECETCLVSIFVNPKQFAPHEDFDRYPRTLERDAALLESVGVQAVFAPAVDVMYPSGFQTSVSVAEIAKPLEGEFRPHFFTGVATVVTRLLLLAGADRAYFGEKDFQQLQVIKALQRDLAIPTDIVGVPTVREASGLALSSRNAYLNPSQKEQALVIFKTLQDMAKGLKDGQVIDALEQRARQEILDSGFEKVDYCTIRDAETLLPPTPETRHYRALIAAWMGQTRLIDNIGIV